MAKIKPIYEQLKDFNDLGEKLCKKHSDKLSNIDMDKVICIMVTNKTRPEKQTTLWSLRALKPPMSLLSPYKYVVSLFQGDWDSMGEKHRAMMVFDILCSIEPGDGDASVIAFDKKGHSTIMRTFGVDYMEDPNIPNLLEESFELKDKQF